MNKKLWVVLLLISMLIMVFFVFIFLGSLLDIKYQIEEATVSNTVIELAYRHVYFLGDICISQFMLILILLLARIYKQGRTSSPVLNPDPSRRLIEKTLLPKDFSYPDDFLKVCDLRLLNLKPWTILEAEDLLRKYNGLQERYRERKLIPFAQRQDNDDVACWDMEQQKNVVIIHDYAAPGWEERNRYPDFRAWFKQAVDDLFEWED